MFPALSAAEIIILAVTAATRTIAEKYSARAFCATYSRFFKPVRHIRCNYNLWACFTESKLIGCPVNITLSRAEPALFIQV